MIYFILAFIIGISIVIDMMLNGKLAMRLGMINGIIINYLMAAITSAILCTVMVRSVKVYSSIASVPLYYFIGGFIGVLTTCLFNLIVPKVSAFYVVILCFIGQLFASAVIDYVYLNQFSKGKVIGGVLFLIGLFLNAKADYRYNREKLSRQEKDNAS
jgi:uncharacterized membrane protein YdcZ (DUF606 family)